MNTLQTSPLHRAELYAKPKNLTIEEKLGEGYDGIVLSTSQGTAIKSFRFAELYRRELEIYEYLTQWSIAEVCGFRIPRLVRSEDNFAIIEMTIVSPPFVLDFVAAQIEVPFSYDEAIMAEWYECKKEEFENDWPLVKRVIFAFQEHGIYLADVHPGNIRCR